MAEKHPIEEVDATLFPFLGIFEVGMMTQISRVFDELVTPQWLVDRFTQYIDTYNFAGVMQYSERRFTRRKETEDYAVERKKNLYYLNYVVENCGQLDS
mmetsp:Transcript_19649/g.56332  ORF Transcript_19649/g.56332 Transcript_19649/m.56332 type:complete len:99 (+) Transcript_19649:85-381(+)